MGLNARWRTGKHSDVMAHTLALTHMHTHARTVAVGVGAGKKGVERLHPEKGMIARNERTRQHK